MVNPRDAERHLSDYKGKVVFLDLWGTWCIQCVADMPTVQALYDRYKNDPEVAFLIVSPLDTPQRVERYARLGNYSLPFFVTRDEDIPLSCTFISTQRRYSIPKMAGSLPSTLAERIGIIPVLPPSSMD